MGGICCASKEESENYISNLKPTSTKKKQLLIKQEELKNNKENMLADGCLIFNIANSRFDFE